MRKKIDNLSINYRFIKFNSDTQNITLKKAINGFEIIPFRGPINKPTLNCAEDLTYRISQNDRYGFKNPNKIYEKKINAIILGDSFAEGWCYNENDDVAGILRKKNLNTLNLGIAGGGPLLSYAVMKEYIPSHNPKYIFFLYCESNDLLDLQKEKNNFLLKNYLDDDFSQKLMKNLEKKQIFLNNMDTELREKFENKYGPQIVTKDKKQISFHKLRDFLELSKIKNITKPLLFFKKETESKELFFKIIDNMNNFSKKRDAEFIFVYLPSWERYFAKYSKYNKYISEKKNIMQKLNSMNIKTIDIDKVFLKQQSLEELFPLNYYGHYSKLGYEKVAETILFSIKGM